VQIQVAAESRVEVFMKPFRLRRDLTLLATVVEGGLVTNVTRGENACKRLRHDAVARVLGSIGSLAPAATSGAFDRQIDLAGAGASRQFRVVAFLQDRRTRVVVGVASTTMASP
jgi:hypothetical protein